jgi:hypothetical protein
MEITIEDVKEELISILTEINMIGGSMVTSAYKDELKMAIDTMRKYQKIERIVNERLKDETMIWEDDTLFLHDIIEVVEDDK